MASGAISALQSPALEALPAAHRVRFAVQRQSSTGRTGSQLVRGYPLRPSKGSRGWHPLRVEPARAVRRCSSSIDHPLLGGYVVSSVMSGTFLIVGSCSCHWFSKEPHASMSKHRGFLREEELHTGACVPTSTVCTKQQKTIARPEQICYKENVSPRTRPKGIRRSIA